MSNTYLDKAIEAALTRHEASVVKDLSIKSLKSVFKIISVLSVARRAL